VNEHGKHMHVCTHSVYDQIRIHDHPFGPVRQLFFQPLHFQAELFGVLHAHVSLVQLRSEPLGVHAIQFGQIEVTQ